MGLGTAAMEQAVGTAMVLGQRAGMSSGGEGEPPEALEGPG
jgi:hypothetical protein